MATKKHYMLSFREPCCLAPMPLVEPHPWFQPLYRRVIVAAVCVGWLTFELIQNEPLWIMLSGAATGYAAWDFFLSGNYRRRQT